MLCPATNYRRKYLPFFGETDPNQVPKVKSHMTALSSVERVASFRVSLSSGLKAMYPLPNFSPGVPGMREGEKRRLDVPHWLAYGKKGYKKTIPEKCVLHMCLVCMCVDVVGTEHVDFATLERHSSTVQL